MFRRRVAACRLRRMKVCVCSVGGGAFRGRAAIHRSASSSTGERKQQPMRAIGESPTPGLFAELGMLPDPGDIGAERLRQPVGARLELCFVIEEYEIEFREWVRHGLVARPRGSTIGARRLFNEAANVNLSQRDLGSERVRD